MTKPEAHVLDNPIWHALNTHHARFALGTDSVKRYPPDIAFFVAFAEMNDAVLRDLAEVVAAGEVVGIGGINPQRDLPGWTVLISVEMIQMVSQQPLTLPESAETIVDLTADDVPEMTDLITLTAPGPFARRTIELGHYVGIRKEGVLVAIAGERFHLPGYREISAVCTHPDYRGRGYAGLLVGSLVNENWARGDVPFLAVETSHTTAYNLYERLGFRPRLEVRAYAVRR